MDRVYLNNLANYNRAVNQRNSLLKEIAYQEHLIDTLDIWDMQLVEKYGTKVIEARKRFIEQVNDIISDIHYKLTGGKETLVLSYESSIGDMSFEEAVKKNRNRDIKFKSTSAGPHP